MFELKKAQPAMAGALKSLWSGLYPEDSPAYIDLFFRHRFVPEMTAVVAEDDAVIGVMYLLPCALPEGKTALYAYAGGISPEARGRGAFRFLIGRLVKACAERDTALFLVPGEGLWDFYRGMGLNRSFWRRSLSLPAGNASAAVEMHPCTAEEYAENRRLLLTEESPVWDVPALEYAAKEAAFGEGGMIRIKGPDFSGTALVTKREEDILLQETTLTPAQLRLAAPELCRAWKVPKVTAHLPAHCAEGTLEQAGLMTGTGVSPGHLALTLVY